MGKGASALPALAPVLVPCRLHWKPPRAAPSVNSSSQLGRDLLHDAGNSGLIVHGDICQRLAVDFDAGFPDAVGELAVGQPALTGRGVDTRDPELAEDTLLGAAIPVGVLPCLHHRFLGDAEDVAAAAAETLGQGENFLVAGASRYTTFDARHVFSPCSSVDQMPAKGSICAM